MSVLLDLSIFPMDRGASVSPYVAPVVAMIRTSNHPYRLTAMGTIIETEGIDEALELVSQATALLKGLGCTRIYATTKLDIREGPMGRLTGKVSRIGEHIGTVDQ